MSVIYVYTKIIKILQAKRNKVVVKKVTASRENIKNRRSGKEMVDREIDENPSKENGASREIKIRKKSMERGEQ